MRKLFKVKVDPTTIDTDKTKNGYLAMFGSIVYYPIGEANTKARMFGGIVEPVTSPILRKVSDITMTQISRTGLSDGVLKALQGREIFTDNQLNEHIYGGDIFSDILSENDIDSPVGITDEAVLEELNLLSQIVGDYVQIAN
jgi:hypothetical protein